MGEIAARLADVVVVTDDNPRTEDPAAIRAAVLDGRPRRPRRGRRDRRPPARDPRGGAPRRARRRRARRGQGPRDRPGGPRRGAPVRRPRRRRRGDPGPGGRRPMIEMTLAEVAEVVGGVAHGDATVTGGAFLDTRTPEPGGLFVAIAGERVDGHDFAAAAGEAGAVAVLGSRPTDLPTVVVDDVTAALGRLARHVVDRLPDVVVLAMTGSQGKTGTKDYLAHVLADAGPDRGHARQLQQRARRPADGAAGHRGHDVPRRRDGRARHRPHRRAVRDRAAARGRRPQRRHRPHRRVRQPRGDRAGQGRDRRGARRPTARPCSTPTTTSSPRWRRAPTRTVVTFGGAGADVAVGEITSDELGRLSFELRHRGSGATVHLAQVGAYQWRNAAAAAAMALAAGLDLDTVADALGDAVPASRWRMELHERPDGLVVVNDAYNANPESMRGRARDARGHRRAQRSSYGRGAGGDARARRRGGRAHGSVGEYAASVGVDVLVAVGPAAGAIAAGFEAGRTAPVWRSPRRGVTRPSDWLRHNVSAADVVLVKASRGAALEVIADELLVRGGREKHADESHPVRRRTLPADLPPRHALRDPVLHAAGIRPADPRRRPHHPPHQARHARPWAARSSCWRPSSATSPPSSSPARRRPRRRCCCCSCSSASALVGFLDDFLKVSRQHNLGLRSRAKMIGQTVVAVVFGVLALSPALEDERGWRPASDHISFIRDYERFALPTVAGDAADLVLRHRLQQRGEPHRRPRRPRGRLLDPRLRRLHARQHLAEQPVLRPRGRARSATRCATRSTSPWSRRRSPAPASASCGGTPRRPRSSWATPARWRWAARWPASRS